MESRNRKILCSTGKRHEHIFETGKWNPQTGKFFVQPEKIHEQEFETGKDIFVIRKLLSQPEKNNPKPKKGIHEIGKLLP